MSIISDEGIDATCFAGFVDLVYKLTGITIKPERQAMLVGRLRRRVRDLKLADFNAYLSYVSTHSAEHENFINQVTTNETYFYRTPRVWDYIEQDFLPDWRQKNPNSLLNVWSAASSTGEEAHTLGIVMQHFKDTHPGFEYRISGTDIDTQVIQQAEAGVYKGRSIARFSEARPELFERYMRGNDEDGFCVVPHIKSRISFSHFNLFSAKSSNPSFDLVLLRNVLIYFVGPDQERVMSTIHQHLKVDGVAIIGESESLNNLDTDFKSISPTIYRAIAQPMSKAA